jgi:hypothetical protein
VITSFNLGEDDIYLFRTPHHERLRRDYKVPAWQVALATSAAPTYFPCSKDVDRQRLIDGGVWANNPTLVGITEAYGTLNVPLNSISVLSIGTFESVRQRRGHLDIGGKLSWALGNTAIDVVMRGQSIAVMNQSRYLLGKENVVRLSPNVAGDEFSLDGIHNVEDLIGKAAHHSRTLMPTIKDKFFTHRAPSYAPIYR